MMVYQGGNSRGQACGKAGRVLEGAHKEMQESLAQNMDYVPTDSMIQVASAEGMDKQVVVTESMGEELQKKLVGRQAWEQKSPRELSFVDDLERGVVEETLPCLTEDDVAYDMDEVLVEDDADLDSDESNTSDEGGSDIYWEEGE